MRQPAVAERFYPGSPQALALAIQELMPSSIAVERRPARAVAVPHAGYVYSGSLAGETLAQVVIPETVLLLGPNHRGRGNPIALSNDTWAVLASDSRGVCSTPNDETFFSRLTLD